MPARCDICDHPDAFRHRLAGLRRVEHARADTEITICERCLGRRTVRQWRRDTPEAKAVIHALTRHDLPEPNHFSYLVRDGRVLLVRLRQDWIDAKAIAHVAAS